MNIFYEVFPENIVINNICYDVVTDFREWIKWLDMLNDKELSIAEKIYFTRAMFIDGCNEPFEDILEAFITFIAGAPTEDVPFKGKGDEARTKNRLLSYNYDAKFIIPDFLKNYGIDLLDDRIYLHWWKFRILLDGLPEETMTKKVIYYRSVDLSKIKDKDERSRIRRIKDSIKLPEEGGVMDDGAIANAFI